MIPLIGYSNHLSVAPGMKIEFKVSSSDRQPYDAKLVRVISGDPNPQGIGIREEELPASFTGSYPSRFQPVYLGSYARIEDRNGFYWRIAKHDVFVLASSEKHSENFILVHEEQLTHVSNCSGEPESKLIRADLIYYKNSNGGAVFSVGSISFCGSLSHNNYDNNIARITNNVICRFQGD